MSSITPDYGSGQNLSRMGEILDAAGGFGTETQRSALKTFAEAVSKDPAITISTPVLDSVVNGTYERSKENQESLLNELSDLLSDPHTASHLESKGYTKTLLTSFNFHTAIRSTSGFFTTSGGVSNKRLKGMVKVGLSFLKNQPSSLSLNSSRPFKAKSLGQRFALGFEKLFKGSPPTPLTSEAFEEAGKTEQASCSTVSTVKLMRDGDMIVETEPKDKSIFDAQKVRAKIRIGNNTYDVQSMGVSFLGRIKGRGAFGRVLIGTDEHGNKIAIKVTRPTFRGTHRMSPDQMAPHATKESRVQMELGTKSEHLMGCSAIGYAKSGDVFTVMPAQSGGDLASRMSKMTRSELDTVLLDTAKGVQAMHSEGILHCDIKPDNILLDKIPPRGSLADFGIAARATTPPSKADNGTPVYKAPEVAKQQGITKKSDVFSFGVTAFEAWTGKLPPYSSDGFSDSLNIDFSKIDWSSITRKLGPLRANLLKSCLDESPGKRPTMDRVVTALEVIKEADLKGSR